MFKENFLLNRKLIFNVVLIKRHRSIKILNLKKDFEINHKLMPDAYIWVHLDGVNFKRLTQVNRYNKPIDQRNVNLMNKCAKHIFDSYKNELVCAYGFSDEFSFVLNKKSNLFNRDLW